MLRLLLLLALSCEVLAQSRDSKIAQAADALKPKLIEWRRDFAMHPELSNREERTSRVVAERLRALKFDEVKTGIALHGVIGVLKGGKPGPVVAWRADMDGLPIDDRVEAPYKSQNKGVKHACGHDSHIAVGLGIAELLAGMRADIPGTVKLIFQPAEEGPPDGETGGAIQMVREGALDNPRPLAIFGLHAFPIHPAGHIGYSNGPMLASADSFYITVKGKKAHGAWPHLSIDAVTIASECVLALQSIRSRRIDPLQPMVLTVGSMHGGNRSNIIAEEVRMEGTLRTFNEGVREGVRTMMKQTMAGCTATHGASFDLRWDQNSYPATINPQPLTDWSVGVLNRVLGQDKVHLDPPVMGAEDFSYFQKEIPGFFYFLGVRNEQRGIVASNHTSEFDLDEDALPAGVKSGAALLLDYLQR